MGESRRSEELHKGGGRDVRGRREGGGGSECNHAPSLHHHIQTVGGFRV